MDTCHVCPSRASLHFSGNLQNSRVSFLPKAITFSLQSRSVWWAQQFLFKRLLHHSSFCGELDLDMWGHADYVLVQWDCLVPKGMNCQSGWQELPRMLQMVSGTWMSSTPATSASLELLLEVLCKSLSPKLSFPSWYISFQELMNGLCLSKQAVSREYKLTLVFSVMFNPVKLSANTMHQKISLGGYLLNVEKSIMLQEECLLSQGSKQRLSRRL